MTLSRKYATLPDLDSAPDIYETPELTDDNSTVPTLAANPQSEFDFDDGDGDEAEGISRSRLRINEARSRFLPADADGLTFSNRFDGKRLLYKSSGRRQRRLEDGTHEPGDFTDDEEDDEESLERRMARLKREVEEVKAIHAKLRSAESSHKDDAAGAQEDNIDTLSRALEEMTKPVGYDTSSAAVAESPTPEAKPTDTGEPANAGGRTYTITYAPTYQESHALAKAADFDRRLLVMEKALGVSSSSLPESGQDGLPRAILPTLDAMDKQIGTLSQASTANLDAISRRVRSLATEQDKLNDARGKAKALRDELGKQASPSAADESEQETKINALYGILPTIESLTPMLPPLLDRLRSLRVIHAEAATASQTLDRLETQQADMAAELKEWKQGIEKMEGAMRNGDATVKENMKVMEGWVKDLEERMSKHV
ncbi:hypothetical protein HIM_03920 [Hirsutella minnesotensis 3608]|uniref:Dynactin subunit 2 n=1 Tax=Hirsutella minnesotensis 3608 TaxID=1043627 RepID=A0A0F8A674_9HYPO|nr:hypothetical protein HIM_03920 [Hirsutella minnesotensis 3608]